MFDKNKQSYRKILTVAEAILAAGILVRIFHHMAMLFNLNYARQTKLDYFMMGVALPYLLIRFIVKSLKRKEADKIEISLDAKNQWFLSVCLIIGLTVGSALLMLINTVLANIFVKDFIDAREGGFMAALEMGIIPIFALLVFGFLNRWPLKQILSVSWKIFIIGVILGAIFGSTYTQGSQSLICGILH